MENYVDWKSTEIFEDGEENYFKEIIWRNHKVKVFVFWDNESKFTKKIIISKTNNLLENEIDYYLEKTKDIIIECLMNNSGPSEDTPKIILRHIEFYGIENVKKKLLKIIGKNDTEKILQKKIVTKEMLKKLLESEKIDIDVEYEGIIVNMYEGKFFIHELFTVVWDSLNKKIKEINIC